MTYPFPVEHTTTDAVSRYAPRFGAPVNNASPNGMRYCGPGVLSAISGLDYEEIEHLVKSMRGDYYATARVEGMMLIEIKEMIERLGMVWVEMPGIEVDGQFTARYEHGGTMKCKIKVRPTFIKWLRMTREARGDDVYMVFTGDHVMLACGDMIVDNRLGYPVISSVIPASSATTRADPGSRFSIA